jgi:hypothetical protein
MLDKIQHCILSYFMIVYYVMLYFKDMILYYITFLLHIISEFTFKNRNIILNYIILYYAMLYYILWDYIKLNYMKLYHILN